MDVAAIVFSRHGRKQLQIIESLTRSSALVGSEGIGALVGERERVRYELLKDGLSLIVNDFTKEEIRHDLLAKMNAKQSRMQLAANLYENMSKVCPGVGMIGTLLGLITMLSNMEDPSTIGGGMAIAMLTTLYGLLLGTFIYAPCGERVAIEADKVQELDLLVLEGVLLLKGKKSSVHLRDIMKTYGNAGPRGGGPKGGGAPPRRRA